MVRIKREILINAPIEKTFSYINKPSNWLEFWPSLIEITDMQLLPNGGYDCEWVYKMAGMQFKGRGTHTDVVLNNWLVIKTKGGVQSTITWTFRSLGSKTKVCLTIDYKVPVILLGKLAEFVVKKMNEGEADLIMNNLQIFIFN